MADYSQQIDDLRTAEEICQRHVITTTVNGVQSSYPRWPNAYANACEKIHAWWLETETMKNSGDEEDRQAVMREALALQCFSPRQTVP
jgi:hypothetical protein